jgi:hypothetical protein
MKAVLPCHDVSIALSPNVGGVAEPDRLAAAASGPGHGRHSARMLVRALVGDLHAVLAPESLARDRELATRLTKPAEGDAAAADLVEEPIRLWRVCWSRRWQS